MRCLVPLSWPLRHHSILRDAMRNITSLLRLPRPFTMTSRPNTSHSQASGPYTVETYRRRDDHKARTGNDNEDSYILTLLTDNEHHNLMTSLRDKYFPRDLNKLAAHVALFRALPGSQMPRIMADLTNLAQSQPTYEISAKKPFRMKRGVGIYVDDTSGYTKTIYQELKKRWVPFLSQQDRSFKAHYTIQNKVDDETLVEQTLQELSEQFRGSRGQVLGLSLYRYDRGFWKVEQDFSFTGKGKR